MTGMLALLAACAFSQAKILDTLVLEGLTSHQPSIVRNSIGLKEKSEFSAADVQNAVKSLYRLGYFRSVDFFVTRETDSAASLLCKLTEYPTIESIEFGGNKKLKQKDFEEKLTMKKGMVLSDALLFDNVAIIKKLYAQKGYLLAEVTPELVPTQIPGNVLVKLKVDEGTKVVVRKIYFTGNTAFKEGKLKSNFKTKEKKFLWGGDFDRDLYQSHLDSLVLFYNDQGYMDARVVKDSVWYSATRKDLYISIEVSEGKQYFSGDMFFEGNKVIETASLTGTVVMKKGKPFQKSKLETTKEYITNAYREEGYLWVQVKDRPSFRGDTVDVTFEIGENKPAIVKKIDITGNQKTKEKVIRRELKIMPGQKYKQSLMMRSVRDIYQLNFFSNVKPDLKPNEDGTVDLLFDIAEKDNIGQLSLGASYSQVDGLMGTFTTSIPNFRGEGQRLDLNVQYGSITQDYSIGFLEPWAFNTPTSLYGSIFYQKRTYYGDLTQYGFRGNASRRLRWPDDYFSFSVGYDIERQEENDTNQYKYPNGIHLKPKGVLSKVSLSLQRDDTDMPKFPSQGSRFAVSPEIAGLGGDYKYLKTVVTYDWYFPLFWKFVLSTKSKFGLISKLGNMDEINISRFDVFSAGGVWITDGILRGYPERTFGGVYDPKDGLSLFTFSSEVRFPILEQMLYLSAFSDMGNTWGTLQDFNLTDLYPGVGVGMRLDVPMLGLIGFDFGYGLREPNNTNPFGYKPHGWEFHFQIGRGF